jgi:hypothetical protein
MRKLSNTYDNFEIKLLLRIYTCAFPHRQSKKLTALAAPGLHCACIPWQLMPVAQLTLEIRIEHAQSLKDRRQVVRSLKDQLRQGYNISVAEMDEAVTWQSATIGVVALSRSRDYLHGLVEEVERAARRILNEHGAELADSFWDYVEN